MNSIHKKTENMEEIKLDLFIQKSTGKTCVDIDQIIDWLIKEKNNETSPEKIKLFEQQIIKFLEGRKTGMVNNIINKF